MKFFVVITVLVAGLCTIHADNSNDTDVNKFTAQFSAINHVKDDLQTFTNQQLEKSYDFLLLSSTFDKYDLNRPGFEKLYRKISDKAWEDTVGLIKYQSKRGLSVQLNGVPSSIVGEVNAGKVKKASIVDSDELSSLQLALGYEKILADESHRIHKKISHAHNDKELHYDPDVAHYLDEEIIEYQSGVIRQLTGHIHNLHSIIKEQETKELGIHMFDEYLEKLD